MIWPLLGGVPSASLVGVRLEKIPPLERAPTGATNSAVSCNLKALAEYTSIRNQIGLIGSQDQIWPGPLFADRPLGRETPTGAESPSDGQNSSGEQHQPLMSSHTEMTLGRVAKSKVRVNGTQRDRRAGFT